MNSNSKTPEGKARASAYHVKWYQKNRTQVLARTKARRDANPELSKKRAKVSRERHKETMRKWRLENKDKCKQHDKRWKNDNPDIVKDMNLRRSYRITLEDYNLLLRQQNNKCKICNRLLNFVKPRAMDAPCVDHCHKSGKIRGILCKRCNSAIGFLDDSIENATNALNYLKENNENIQDNPD